MAEPFHRIRYHVADKIGDEAKPVIGMPAVMRSGHPTVRTTAQGSFTNDETAARHYLSRILTTEGPVSLRGLATTSAAPVPSLELRSTQDLAVANTRLLKFQQTYATVPVFGSQVSVELRPDRSLVAVDGDMADIPPMSPFPRTSQEQAVSAIAAYCKADAEKLKPWVRPATLTLYHAADMKWHLCYFFRNVPVAVGGPSSAVDKGHGLRRRPGGPEYDFLVDTDSGVILFYYSSNPTASVVTLNDVLNQPREIFVESQSPVFELHDSIRKLRTYDLGGKDYWQPLPDDAIRAGGSPPSFAAAAVSAHANAAHVHSFYMSVLSRNGIDDKGMYVVSVVNVTDSSQEAPPTWNNAVWYQNKMWYGQDKDADGNLHSFARFLDVIAHELTHGVTQYTSDLVYRNQSGALNESFSDIFGVLINNWEADGNGGFRFRPVVAFDWQIGRGLGANGKPLRDLSNPTVTGDPAHMNEYLTTAADDGGVHTNSNIHNKAAYNVLTSQSGGQPVFTPREVAILYYLCLTRLPRMADFARARQAMLDVAKTFYEAQGDAVRTMKLDAIKQAYSKVGIE